MKKTLLTLFLSVLALSARSQTFNGGTDSILDFQPINIPIVVSGLPTSINLLTFGIEEVCFDVTHTYLADLSISLTSPDGISISLVSSVGGGADNFTGTCLRADAATSIVAGNAPYTGTFKPQGPLASFNNNQNPNGTWILTVNDNAGADVGFLNSCAITFGSNPATFPVFLGSDLPLVVLNTFGATIPDEPKISATMKIITNTSGNLNFPADAPVFSGFIGIEQRGSSSAGFPQKSYGFETRNASQMPIDTALLGMPSESDWILYAPYNDKSCIRNILTYDLSNQMGMYASRTKLCEVFLNNDYVGIYVLMEKIKRDNNRVDIAKLLPIDSIGDQLTGGYIVKIDKSTGSGGGSWLSNFQTAAGQDVYFNYHYPSETNITAIQTDYIQKYIDSFEVAINSPQYQDPLIGYRKYAKTETFVDFLLLNELSKNVDAYRISTFLHKDKDSKDGRLRMGPIWDFNLAWWNADYCEGDSSGGFAYILAGCGDDTPTWWAQLMSDPQFQFDLRCRYDSLRETLLSEQYLYNFIDSLGNYLDNAKTRHFEEWPILGVYTWPNPSPLPQTYAEELTAIKTWIQERLAWLDVNLPGICDLRTEESALSEAFCMLYPNPAKETITIRIKTNKDELQEVKIYSTNGQLFKTINLTGFEKSVSIADLPIGTYLLEIRTSNSMIHKRLVKE